MAGSYRFLVFFMNKLVGRWWWEIDQFSTNNITTSKQSQTTKTTQQVTHHTTRKRERDVNLLLARFKALLEMLVLSAGAGVGRNTTKEMADRKCSALQAGAGAGEMGTGLNNFV